MIWYYIQDLLLLAVYVACVIWLLYQVCWLDREVQRLSQNQDAIVGAMDKNTRALWEKVFGPIPKQITPTEGSAPQVAPTDNKEEARQ